MMKSVKLQLLVMLVATVVVAGVFATRGLPPDMDIHGGAVKGDVGAVQRNICWGVDVNAKDNIDVTPLHWASWEGHKDVAGLLIDKGADVNAKSNEGDTPLHYAAMSNNTMKAKLLIAKGADVSAADDKGKTPQMIAIKKGHDEVADLLRRHGARE